MKQGPSTYRSYLLRLRYFDDAGRPLWRISLQEPGQGEEIHFLNLAELDGFLAKIMAPGKKTDRSESGKK